MTIDSAEFVHSHSVITIAFIAIGRASYFIYVEEMMISLKVRLSSGESLHH